MNFLAKFPILFISSIILIFFLLSAATGYYLIFFPIYILIIIATSNSTKNIFKTVFHLCLISMLISIYLALKQLPDLKLVDFLGSIIAVLSAVAAYIILLSKNPNQPSNTQIHNEGLSECQHNRQLEHLSGSVAHNFNNVMSVVMGNAELLKVRLSQPENSKIFINAILQAIKSGTILTENLLSFAQKQFLQPDNTDLNHLIINYLNDINLPLNDKNKIHYTATKDLWIARIDPVFFEKCLLHLVQNAIQANSKHITIEVSNDIDNSSIDETLGEPMRYLSVMISDDGVGISNQNLKRIYQPFFTTKKATPNKGLGLSVVWGFCQQSGGCVSVVSTSKKGASFKIIVPAILSEK